MTPNLLHDWERYTTDYGRKRANTRRTGGNVEEKSEKRQTTPELSETESQRKQKEYEERTKGKKKAQIESQKEQTRAEDREKGIYFHAGVPKYRGQTNMNMVENKTTIALLNLQVLMI